MFEYVFVKQLSKLTIVVAVVIVVSVHNNNNNNNNNDDDDDDDDDITKFVRKIIALAFLRAQHVQSMFFKIESLVPPNGQMCD